jgi:signal transduction histidine kinase
LLRAADQEWTTAPDVARGYVRSAMTMARDNLAETRQFIHGLVPPALDGSSLSDALTRLCATTTERAGLKVELRVDGEPYPLGVDAEIALLRVAQGALANVGEHARAGTAVVTLAYLPEGVRMDVGDDGVGFDPAANGCTPDRGFGLPGIRHRIAALGGVTTVESAPGEGTVVAVSVPVSGNGAPVSGYGAPASGNGAP